MIYFSILINKIIRIVIYLAYLRPRAHHYLTPPALDEKFIMVLIMKEQKKK